MRLNEVLSNEKLVRQIRLWSVIIGGLSVFLIYLFISNDIGAKIKEFYNLRFEVTGLGVLAIFVSHFIVKEFNYLAVDNIRISNDKINKSYEELYDEKNSISSDMIDLAIIYIDEANKDAQTEANKKLTRKLIVKYTNKLTKAKIRSWKLLIKYYNYKINKFKKNIAFDKSFKPLKHSDVLENNSSNIKYKDTYRNRYIHNPTATNWILKTFFTPLKFAMVGGSLIGTFSIGLSWEGVVMFYLGFIALTALLSLIGYLWVWFKVKNKTYSTNLNMIIYIKDMKKYIKEHNKHTQLDKFMYDANTFDVTKDIDEVAIKEFGSVINER